mmetsp:Transcript_26738/g.89513  ORF Transcript_26738/g.89513 Transcript_26738/m.89513 type:complete len:226 (+) Transcript_26738:1094-1771(+)
MTHLSLKKGLGHHLTRGVRRSRVMSSAARVRCAAYEDSRSTVERISRSISDQNQDTKRTRRARMNSGMFSSSLTRSTVLRPTCRRPRSSADLSAESAMRSPALMDVRTGRGRRAAGLEGTRALNMAVTGFTRRCMMLALVCARARGERIRVENGLHTQQDTTTGRTKAAAARSAVKPSTRVPLARRKEPNQRSGRSTQPQDSGHEKWSSPFTSTPCCSPSESSAG